MTNEINQLLAFLDGSPTAWHAVDAMSTQLEEAGFKKLSEGDTWKLSSGGHYYVVRNGSSICAFVLPKATPEKVHLIGTHSDSPGFKLKPNAEFVRENMILLAAEVYGSPLISSWLNRDLGVAGRIIYEDAKGAVHESLVRIDDAPMTFPQIAIHLDKQANDTGPALNRQDHLIVLAALLYRGYLPGAYLEKKLKEKHPYKTLFGSDLFLFPLQSAALTGNEGQMVASYRIDNLASVHAALKAICKGKKPHENILKMVVAWDNEEVGSETAQGAASPFVADVLERIMLALKMGREEFLRLLHASLCISADQAHATHPNYADRHEPRHPILMQGGIVIKYNAQQRYATDARSAALVVELCRKLKVPFQSFVTRGDIPCGSTIGPIHARKLGMPTVDLGIGQLSMHSCRELASVKDYEYLCTLLAGFFA